MTIHLWDILEICLSSKLIFFKEMTVCSYNDKLQLRKISPKDYVWIFMSVSNKSDNNLKVNEGTNIKTNKLGLVIE